MYVSACTRVLARDCHISTSRPNGSGSEGQAGGQLHPAAAPAGQDRRREDLSPDRQ